MRTKTSLPTRLIPKPTAIRRTFETSDGVELVCGLVPFTVWGIDKEALLPWLESNGSMQDPRKWCSFLVLPWST